MSRAKIGQYTFKRLDFPIIRALAMRQDGMSDAKIGHAIGKDRCTVENWWRWLGLTRPARCAVPTSTATASPRNPAASPKVRPGISNRA